MIKLLVTSPFHPQKINPRIAYVKYIKKSLSYKIDVKICWLVTQKNDVNYNLKFDDEIFYVENFKNAYEFIEFVKPDIYLANPTLEPVNEAISLVAFDKKIPIICFEHSFFFISNFIHVDKNKLNLLFSNILPSDNSTNKKFLKRFNFYFIKILFLFKTKWKFNKNIKKLFLLFFEIFNLINYTSGLNPYGQIYLVSGEYSLKSPSYFKSNIQKKIKIVGNPYWDIVSKKIKTTELFPHQKIKILIVTDSLHEHGFWTDKQRDHFLSKLISNIKSESNFVVDFKIHPSSENINFYENLIKDQMMDSKIYQKEDLWDMAKNYDIFLTYGYSQVHFELAYSGRKTILLNSCINLPLMTLVKEAIDIGTFKQSDNDESLVPFIHNFHNEKVSSNKDFEKIISKYIPLSKNNSAEIISNIILDVNDKKNIDF